MLSNLTRYTENRKGKLVSLLNFNKDTLSLEKQHQIYGAISELDYLADMLKNLKDEEIEKENNPGGMFLFKPE